MENSGRQTSSGELPNHNSLNKPSSNMLSSSSEAPKHENRCFWRSNAQTSLNKRHESTSISRFEKTTNEKQAYHSGIIKKHNFNKNSKIKRGKENSNGIGIGIGGEKEDQQGSGLGQGQGFTARSSPTGGGGDQREGETYRWNRGSSEASSAEDRGGRSGARRLKEKEMKKGAGQ